MMSSKIYDQTMRVKTAEEKIRKRRAREMKRWELTIESKKAMNNMIRMKAKKKI
jgi:hypothetical protein